MSELFARAVSFADLGMAAKDFMALLALSCARLYALALIFPPLGDQAVQGSARNGLCLSLGFYLAWGQPLHIVEGLGTLQLLALMLKEGMLGLTLGFAAASVFWVAEGAGALIDNQAGFNNVQQSNPMSGGESTPLGNLLSQLAYACFWMLGGITALLGVLFESYRWWPMNRMVPDVPAALLLFAQSHLGTLMTMLVTLAAPMMLVLLLIDLGFGLIGKTAEKLEPNSLSQPVKGAVAMLMLSLLVALFFHEARPLLALQALQQDVVKWLEDAARQGPRR